MPVTDRLHHAVSLRLSERQYRHAVAQANLAGVGISEALRQVLDRDIEAQPDLDGDVALSYSALLSALDLEAALAQTEGRD